ncbi:MAG: type VI secretion system protein TssA [Planctomycetota bacterium]
MLDTEALLRPISDEAPAGANLRDDPSSGAAYYEIKDARNAARAVERAARTADDPSTAPQADWSPILELAPAILAEKSKDLEVAAWLLEALVRERGYGGLADGFELVRGLVVNFWDHLHPMPDEDGMLTRVAPLTGLNGDDSEGTLIVPIGMVPLLEDELGELGPWHFRSARDLQAVTDPEVRQRRIESGAVPMERFDAALLGVDAAHLYAAMDDLERAIAGFAALCDALDERCGRDGPPVSNIRHALEESLDCLKFLTRDLPRPAEGGGASDSPAAAALRRPPQRPPPRRPASSRRAPTRSRRSRRSATTTASPSRTRPCRTCSTRLCAGRRCRSTNSSAS